MTSRLLATLLVPLLATATAYAQAPGEWEATGAPGMTDPSAPVANPCTGAMPQINPLARRIAVGLSLRSMNVERDSEMDKEIEFHGAELDLRYRLTRRWEIFLAFGGGRQVLEGGGEQGDLATDSVTLGARFRFMPERKWNWFLSAGMGRTVIAHYQSTKEEREALSRPHGMFGIGLERRWRAFALQAEIRGMSIGPSEEAMVEPVRPTTGDASVPPVKTDARADELGGGVFTLGGSYYF
jgi:hypothetical protein